MALASTLLSAVLAPWFAVPVPMPAVRAAVEPPPRETLAVVGVTVLTLDAEERVLEDHTVVVSDGLIAAMGPSDELPAPEGAEVVDGAGRWLVPGLVEMHGHLPMPGGPAGFDDDVLMLYLANGVTTVRGMLGHPSHLALREEIAAGTRAGPRLFVGSPAMHGGLGLTPETAASQVAGHAAAGYDHLKVHEGLPPAVYAAIAEAADEHGITFGGHVSDLVGLWDAVDAGQTTLDHMDNVVEALLPEGAQPTSLAELASMADRERLPEVAARLAEADVAVVPTHALWANLFGGASGDALRARHPELAYLPKPMVDGWVGQANAQSAQLGESGRGLLALRDEALVALHEAGVPVLMGTDSPQLFSVPGFSMHREMDALTEAGLSNAVVLDACTAAAARFYGEDYAAGRVAPGLRADLLLLDADPREDLDALARPRAVLADGRRWSRERLDAELARIRDSRAP